MEIRKPFMELLMSISVKVQKHFSVEVHYGMSTVLVLYFYFKRHNLLHSTFLLNTFNIQIFKP